MTEKMNGAQLLVESLVANGVKNVYGLVGIPVTDVARLMEYKGIHFYGFRREDAAVEAAAIAGYLTGKPGFALTVSAPGFLNGLVALKEATQNCFPMVMMSGSSDRALVDMDRGEYEGLDQYNIAKPLCKAAYRIDKPEDVGLGVARAIRTALTGRPGGVYLDIPGEMLGEFINSDIDPMSTIQVPVDPAPAQEPSDEAIQRAVDVLTNAKQPAILIGKGAAYAKAEDQVRDFVESTNIPFVPMSMAKGVLPDGHKCSAAAARSLALGQSDVIVLVGARLNWLLSNGASPKPFGRDVKFIQIDIDGEEIDSNRHIEAPLVGDMVSVFKKLIPAVKATGYKAPQEWIDQIEAKRSANEAKMNARYEAGRDREPMGFYGALLPIKELIAEHPDTYLVSEGANTLDMGRNVIDIFEPRHRLDTGTWGVMGVGLPYAVGAAVETGRPVIALEGDSAFGFDAMEMETICRYKLPVIVVVVNNGGIYNAKGAELNGMFGPTFLAPEGHYEMLSSAFGGRAYEARNSAELTKYLKEAYESGEPTIINAVLDPNMGAESGHIGHLNPVVFHEGMEGYVAPKAA
ncbi:MAG: oxalyl-CoA decarboxylase [Aeriscardovia sp.]|nr:oxalyl-CoA decarboxylase [Aeriscardovia sp.]